MTIFESEVAGKLKAKVWLVKFSDAPQSESDAVFALRMSLLKLVELFDDFRAAERLFTYCSGLAKITPLEEDYLRWQRIAIREGAFALDQYVKALKLPLRNKRWQDKINRAQLSELRTEFDRAFPFIERVRHSIVHRSEMVASSDDLKKNSVKSKQTAGGFVAGFSGGAVGIPDTYIGDQYSATHEGKLVSYRLSQAAVQKLEQITTGAIGAFDAVI